MVDFCPRCFSDSFKKAGIRKGKQRFKCKDCGYQFVENPKNIHRFCGLYTSARKNFIRISKSMAEGMDLEVGDGISFSFDHGTMAAFKEPGGFDIKLNTDHLEVYDNTLYKYVCRFFELDHHFGFRFEGEVINKIWTMKKITKKNIHEVIGYTDYRRKLPPTATIMSNRQLLFSAAAIDLLMIDKADNLDIVENDGKIYIGVNPEGEFHISKTESAATIVSSKKIGDFFMKMFDIKAEELPFRLSIQDKGMVESEGVTYFEIGSRGKEKDQE